MRIVGPELRGKVSSKNTQLFLKLSFVECEVEHGDHTKSGVACHRGNGI
jgi:hypothetical protein